MLIKIDCETGPVWVNTDNIVTVDSHTGYDGWELALTPHAKYHYVDVYRERNPDFEEILDMLTMRPSSIESFVCETVIDLAKRLSPNE